MLQPKGLQRTNTHTQNIQKQNHKTDFSNSNQKYIQDCENLKILDIFHRQTFFKNYEIAEFLKLLFPFCTSVCVSSR